MGYARNGWKSCFKEFASEIAEDASLLLTG